MRTFLKIQFPFILLNAIILLFIISCKDNSIEFKDEDPFKTKPCIPLTDDIPFEALGSGKIVFDRTTNSLNGGDGYHIIDIDKKASYGFRLNGPAQGPCVSPDGTKIASAIITTSPFFFDICLMDIDGSNCFPIIKSDYKDYYPTWTPDGSKIVFRGGLNEGPLYMISPVENANDTVILTKFFYYNDPEWLIFPSGGFSISVDQKLIGVSYSSFNGIIKIAPYVGKSGVSLLLPATETVGYESPVFSPDGKKIAFLSIEHDSLDFIGFNSVSVNTMNPDGGEITELVKVNTFKTPVNWTPILRRWDVSLCWSPDGSKILFTAPIEEYGCHLFVINSDGTGLTQVTENVNAWDYDISWSM
jgi:Tol biopolymer transport system component